MVTVPETTPSAPQVAPATPATAQTPAAPTQAQPAGAPKVETATPASKPEVPDERVQLLAKRERALQQQARAVKEQQEQIAKAKADYEDALKKAVGQQIAAFKQKARVAPLDVLKELDLSYDELTEAQLEQGKRNPASLGAKLALDKVAELEAKLAEQRAEQERQAKERAAAEEQRAQAEFKMEIRSEVNDLAEQYPLTATYKAYDAVELKLQELYRRTGQMPTYEQAIKEVEEFLASQISKGQELLAKRAQPKPEAPAASTPSVKPTEAQPSSISNDMTASTGSAKAQAVSAKDRYANAIAALSKLDGPAVH
jgi:hypothetical protein